MFKENMVSAIVIIGKRNQLTLIVRVEDWLNQNIYQIDGQDPYTGDTHVIFKSEYKIGWVLDENGEANFSFWKGVKRMKLYVINYWDFDKPDYYIVVAKDAVAAQRKAAKKYQQDNDTSSDFMVDEIFELTEWEGYKISLTRKRLSRSWLTLAKRQLIGR
jgi:hypothetical protein